MERSAVIFDSLSQAVDFIAGCLEAGDSQALVDAFSYIDQSKENKAWMQGSFLTITYPDLRRRHQEQNLRERYQGRLFPAGEDTLLLGGHFAELGCINIRFARLPEGWALDHILSCR